MDDYVVYWVAGRMVLRDEANKLYNLEEIKAAEAQAVAASTEDVLVLPFYNPPFIAGLMAPLAAVPLGLSAVLFTATMLLALALALRLLLTRLDNPLEAGIWTIGVVSSLPFFYTVGHGQFSFLLLLVFTAIYLLLKKEADLLAGLTLSLLLMKPQLLVLVLLVLVMKRRYTAIRGFALGTSALGTASLLLAGPGFLLEYPNLLIQAARWDDQGGILTWAMYGWNAFFRGVVGPNNFDVVSLLGLAASAGTLAICVSSWQQPWEPSGRDFDLRFSVLVLATLLTSPHLYGQDLIIAVLPAVLLYTAWKDSPVRSLSACFLVTCWLLMYFHFSILTATGVNFVTLAMFIMALGGVSGLTRGATLAAEPSPSVFRSPGLEPVPDAS